VMGALLLPVMLVAGWQDRPQWPALLLWLVPIVEPPTAGWAEPVTGVLWYLVAYLWLVLLSPLLLRCYQRARLMTVGTPIAGLATLENAPPILGEALGSAATDVLTFMSCWVLGFAHRGGDLKRIHLGVLIPLAATLVGAGLAWEITHPGDDGVDLSAEPVAYAVYSVGFVLLLLRVSPTMQWLNRRRFLNGFVNLCNARAVTIYLWHNTAITLCFTVGSAIAVDRVGPHFEMAAFFAVALVLLGGFIVVLGWVEDVAARRPVRLLPWSKVPSSRPRPVTPEWSGPIWF
ncbi:acyltransferase family protein, partial [Actinoplanes sp. ATCC 53533]|uniref:acyltransferase family protein n=1 Tax=Actinoplanes sp. ATCC 53533 TaxID=1288362 RepID=UPI0011D04B25